MELAEQDRIMGSVIGGLLTAFPEFPIIVFWNPLEKRIECGLLGEEPESDDYYLKAGSLDKVAGVPDQKISESIGQVIKNRRPHYCAVGGSDSGRTRTSNQLIKSQP